MKPNVLKPKLIRERVETPQCSAPVDPPTHANMWRRDRYKKLRPHYDPDLCQRESTIEIGGKCYCRLHASGLALDKWIGGELVERKDHECAARKQGTAGGNDPADCNWPMCGCDGHADTVIAALQESGLLK